MAHITQRSRGAPHSTTLTVTELATRALAELATGSGRSGRMLGGGEAQALCDVLFDEDGSAYENLVVRMFAEGLKSEDLLDQIIPDTARLLGEEWLADERSFADVTVATSRLQQTARTIGARHERDGLNIPIGHRALLVLPETEQHSLGAFIIANQLRRQGVWVQMLFSCDAHDLEAFFEDHPCSMIGLSIGSDQSLAQAPANIGKIRSFAADIPIVLGGTALAGAPARYAEQIGADFVARTGSEALEFCKINIQKSAAMPQQFIDA